jgi:hypothetical protein
MPGIHELPRSINKRNINEVISAYKEMLGEIPLTITATTAFQLLKKLKRDEIGKGPYPDVSIFESSNRIMSDLVILFGTAKLLNGSVKELDFDEYRVEFGNESSNEYDITAIKNGKKLKGEAFNVAPSFFQGKKTKMLNKLRRNAKPNDILLIMFNADAVDSGYTPKRRNNEYYLPVEIEL